MIDSIVPITSDEISVVSPSACSASVRTAVSTASLAASDLGLNSLLSSRPKLSDLESCALPFGLLLSRHGASSSIVV